VSRIDMDLSSSKPPMDGSRWGAKTLAREDPQLVHPEKDSCSTACREEDRHGEGIQWDHSLPAKWRLARRKILVQLLDGKW
jgi:hypothetical protein